MAAHTFESIMKDLKKKVYHPVYFLHGEESYYIDQLSDYIEKNVLSDMEKEFNQSVLYGRDVDILTVLSNAKRYPMMSNYQVVIVKEAQDMKDLFKKKKDDDDDDEVETKSSASDNDPFLNYILNPQKSTVLVFCYKYKKVDKRTKSGKQLEKSAVMFESKKLYDNQVPAWVTNYVKAKGFQIRDEAAELLGDYLGADLNKVANELDKLMINVPEGKMIDNALIEQNIGISKDFNVFELQAAIARKDFLKVNRIVNYFAANPKNNPFIVTISNLFLYFNKIISFHAYKNNSGVNIAAELGINPFFLKEYQLAAKNYSLPAAVRTVSLLHEYDLRSKGVNSNGVPEGELLKELVFKIMHPAEVIA